VTTQLATLARRTSVVLLAGALVVAGGPAGADTPEGWPEAPPVDAVEAVLLLVGIPLLIFVVVTLLVVVPGVVKGERLTPGGYAEDQWFGGPRQGTSELAAPDTEAPKAGGASARW
jgi:hypothetical protein